MHRPLYACCMYRRVEEFRLILHSDWTTGIWPSAARFLIHDYTCLSCSGFSPMQYFSLHWTSFRAGSALLCTDGWWMWVRRFSSFLDDGHRQQPACTFIWTIIHLHTHIQVAFHKFSLRLYPYSELLVSFLLISTSEFLLMMSVLLLPSLSTAMKQFNHCVKL